MPDWADYLCEFCMVPFVEGNGGKLDGDGVPLCDDCYKDAIENHLGDIVNE